MHQRWLRLAVAVGALGVGLCGGASAQVSVENSFIRLFLNSTGDIVTGSLANATPPGIVFSPNDNVSVLGKEMVAAMPFPAEAWVLKLPTPQGDLFIRNGGLADGYGQVIDGGSGTSLSRTFAYELGDGSSAMVRLYQTVSITNAGPDLGQKRVQFAIDLENLTNQELEGLSYLRTVNPKQGVTPDLPNQSVGTDNHLGTLVYPEGVAVDSTIPTVGLDDPLQRHLAIGSTVLGTRVNAVGNAFGNLDADLLATFGYSELAALGPPGITTVGPVPFNSGDLITPVALNLWWDASVIGNIAAGQRKSIGSFYYVFDGPVQQVPEPGAPALLAGAALGGLTVLRVRRRARPIA